LTKLLFLHNSDVPAIENRTDTQSQNFGNQPIYAAKQPIRAKYTPWLVNRRTETSFSCIR